MVDYSFAASGIGHSGDETYVVVYIEENGYAYLSPDDARLFALQILKVVDHIETRELLRAEMERGMNHA